MKITTVAAQLTRPEMFYGIPKEAVPILTMIIAVLMGIRFFAEFSMLYLIAISVLFYGVFVVTARIDPFYFSITQKKGSLRTKNINKNKGNFYVS